MTEDIKHEISVEDATFVKVSTNPFGALRFKVIKKVGCDIENEKTVDVYADQISTDNKSFTAAEARKLPGFKIITVQDKQRCLKPLTPQNSESSSQELPTP